MLLANACCFQMALPYEVGLYYKFDMGGPAQRPMGCPGMNLTVDEFPHLQGKQKTKCSQSIAL